MPKNIRVYELAREMGMTNAEMLDLCISLGIGVKSHSSGMVEAHADRARRKADREGLRRDVQPEDPAKLAKSAKAKSKSKAKEAEPADESPVDSAAPPVEEPAVAEPAPPAAVVEAVVAPEPVAIDEVASAADSEPVVAEVAPAVADPEPEPVASRRVITSTGSAGPPRKIAEPDPALAQPDVEPTPRDDGPTVPDLAARVIDPDATPVPPAGSTPPLSASGKMIPPPPGQPVSSSGKPIPPPPGMGGRRTPAPTGPAPGRRTGPPPVGRRPPMGGGPRESVPGAGARPGGGPGGRPGSGPGGRRPPRRKGRRRRSREELQPMDVPAYTPDDAAVPDGVVVVERSCTGQDLGPMLNRTAADVVRFLMEQGEMVTATQSLSDDMIELFAAELGVEIRMVDPGEEQEVELLKLLDVVDDLEDDEAPIRPPIVTVMGHVDHGKTKLLDRIRNANVVDDEAGGITQHIGATNIEWQGHKITMIDTPGHEAFASMRARGANSTDIVVLVIAANDGFMPQTIEALNHARDAKVPIVVALNKIDLENADIDRVLMNMQQNDMMPEPWGGEFGVCNVSAMTGEGIDGLLERLVLEAEMLELKCNSELPVRAYVLESQLESSLGPTANILIKNGTIKVGDVVICGQYYGKVKALFDCRGTRIESAGPSMPVKVVGLSGVPDSGAVMAGCKNERQARRLTAERGENARKEQLTSTRSSSIEDLFNEIEQENRKELKAILRSDVQGTCEAVIDGLNKLQSDKIDVDLVLSGVGAVTENDVILASASNALIIGFHVRVNPGVNALAKREGVTIMLFSVIYELIEQIRNSLEGMLDPVVREENLGRAQILQVFTMSKSAGKICGCTVSKGVVKVGAHARVHRKDELIYNGTISSLRHFTDDVKEVRQGFECGILLDNFTDFDVNDIIDVYEYKESRATL